VLVVTCEERVHEAKELASKILSKFVSVSLFEMIEIEINDREMPLANLLHLHSCRI
jgi:hypothetical protein